MLWLAIYIRACCPGGPVTQSGALAATRSEYRGTALTYRVWREIGAGGARFRHKAMDDVIGKERFSSRPSDRVKW
jgi:hypothetical protein